jgi:hypothetical protein
MNDSNTTKQDPLEEAIQITRAKVADEGTTLEELMDVLGHSKFAFLSLLLSVPFIQPVSLGPINMIGGLAFVVLGWAMMRQDSSFRLPKKVAGFRLQGKFWAATLDWMAKILAFCRRFTRKRLVSWCRGTKGEWFVGFFILSGGLILAIPLANLPFNNTFPALMVFCAALAWLEEDGLWMVFSIVWCLVSLAYCGIIIYGFVVWVLFGGGSWILEKFTN